MSQVEDVLKRSSEMMVILRDQEHRKFNSITEALALDQNQHHLLMFPVYFPLQGPVDTWAWEKTICKMYYEYLFPEFLEEEDPSFFEANEDLIMSTKGGYYPKPCPPYKCVIPSKPRYCPPKYPPPCPYLSPPFNPQRPACYPLYPLPQWPKPCYPSYPWKSYPPQWPKPCYPSYPWKPYPPQWLCPKPFPCIPQKGYYPPCQLPCPPYWGRPWYPKCPPQYPCDFLEIY
ncbi:hypothetical protein NXF25_018314 [Crotalus adamanteus]|uniref:Uncharacterized protein n=1 Tax=Crotalus adamanteus TaxID=8729 RepID=A0AAW1ANB3_CROAD